MSLLMSKIESLLFVTGDEGLSAKQIESLTGATSADVKEALLKLQEDYLNSEMRGIELKELAGTFQLISKRDNAGTIQRLVDSPTSQPLSQASLEVLAIVAYKQPITRIEIEDLRGVKCERPLHTLSIEEVKEECIRCCIRCSFNSLCISTSIKIISRAMKYWRNTGKKLPPGIKHTH